MLEIHTFKTALFYFSRKGDSSPVWLDKTIVGNNETWLIVFTQSTNCKNYENLISYWWNHYFSCILFPSEPVVLSALIWTSCAAIRGGFSLDLGDASGRRRLTAEQINWSPAYLDNCKRQFIIIKSGAFDWRSAAEMHSGRGKTDFASCLKAAGLKKTRKKNGEKEGRQVTSNPTSCFLRRCFVVNTRSRISSQLRVSNTKLEFAFNFKGIF